MKKKSNRLRDLFRQFRIYLSSEIAIVRICALTGYSVAGVRAAAYELMYRYDDQVLEALTRELALCHNGVLANAFGALMKRLGE